MLKFALLSAVCVVAAASAGTTEAECKLQCAAHRLSSVGDFVKQLLGEKQANTAPPMSATKSAMCIHYCVATARRADICQGMIEWSIKNKGRRERPYSAASKQKVLGECVLFLQQLDDVAAIVGYCAVVGLIVAVVVIAVGSLVGSVLKAMFSWPAKRRGRRH